MIYWGDGGQFGPFDTQEDGWPNAGQVMRYFREKLGMTAKAFGELYGKRIREDRKPICERWILGMELENKVPVDITRRRIIAHLLGIPFALLGLASLEDITTRLQMEHTVPPVSPSTSKLKKDPIDISRYEKNVLTALNLHRASNARDLLQDVNEDRRDLVCLEGQARGALLYRIRELLVGNDLMAAKVLRDQRQYIHAYTYANHALEVARSMEDDELIATAKYTRGCIQLQRGQFGVMKQRRFQLDRKNIEDAIRDFQDILDKITSQQISIHPQLHGFTLLQLGRAWSLLRVGKYDSRSTNAQMLADQAAHMIERNTIDDPYTRMLVTGTLSGLHLGGYYLTRADIFNAAGLPGEAIHELNKLGGLVERTYGQDETRNQAWSNIVHAKVLVNLKEYNEGANKAKVALVACHTIHSMQNVTIILDLHSRLISSSYGSSKNVKELGDMLEEWYGLLQGRAVYC